MMVKKTAQRRANLICHAAVPHDLVMREWPPELEALPAHPSTLMLLYSGKNMGAVKHAHFSWFQCILLSVDSDSAVFFAQVWWERMSTLAISQPNPSPTHLPHAWLLNGKRFFIFIRADGIHLHSKRADEICNRSLNLTVWPKFV